MSETAARRADSRRSRERILAAAEELLRVSPRFAMSDLARRSGLTRATVYRHFADREQVLDALAGSLADALLPHLLEALADLDLDAALDRLAHEVVALAVEHAHVIGGHHRQLHEIARLVVPDEPFATLLAERRARGELGSPLDDAWLARCIRALCLSALEPVADAGGDAAPVSAAALSATLRAVVRGTG